jgi:CheY-like chemotaxis protein
VSRHGDPYTFTLRILLAEDNVTNQLIIRKLLHRLGQTNVTAVEDGQQAVEACQTTRFDLILMDVMMPVMSGWEATRQIRAMRDPAVLIVGLTAVSAREDLRKCLDIGMDRVVTKPIQAGALECAIEWAQQRTVAFHNSPADVSQ